MADDTLTADYRAGQLATRARTLRELTPLWSILDITALSATIGPFTTAAARLVMAGWWASADDTVEYLADFREEQGAPGRVRFRPATPPSTAEVAGLVRGAALSGIINGRRQGMNATRAMKNGLVKTLGQAGRTVLDGGRAAVVVAADRDPAARGYARDVSAGACRFCRMLASRGPAYLSEKTASFEAHGHCGCTGRLVYRR